MNRSVHHEQWWPDRRAVPLRKASLDQKHRYQKLGERNFAAVAAESCSSGGGVVSNQEGVGVASTLEGVLVSTLDAVLDLGCRMAALTRRS